MKVIIAGSRDINIVERNLFECELGYVKGNIRVISTQANRMKWDSTQEELEIFCRGVLALGKEGN